MNKLEKIKSLLLSEFSFFMTSIALIWEVFFLFLPLLFIILISGIQYSPVTHSFTFTGEHYYAIFDSIHAKIIGSSLFLALFVSLICLIIAYPVAYYIALKVERFKNVLLFFLVVPFWTNLLVLVYSWFFILERDGLINNTLLMLGMITKPLSLLNNLGAIAIVMIYCYLPFMLLPIFSVLDKFDKTLIEASLDLGATQWQTFYKIVLPLSLSGVRTGFFLVFVPAFGEFVIPLLMGGDKYMFVGNAISHYFLVAMDFQVGAAFTCLSGIILILVIGMSTLLFFKRMKRKGKSGEK